MIKNTQQQRIIDYIDRFGSISPIEAFTDLGITKLATRIGELQNKGYYFSKKWETNKNRYGETVRYMRYFNDNEQSKMEH